MSLNDGSILFSILQLLPLLDTLLDTLLIPKDTPPEDVVEAAAIASVAIIPSL